MAFLIVAIALYGPQCLMCATPPNTSASMHCHAGDPAQQGQDLRPCCKDEGVVVPVFHPQPQTSHLAIPPLNSPAGTSHESDFTWLPVTSPPKSVKSLAELCLLRI